MSPAPSMVSVLVMSNSVPPSVIVPDSPDANVMTASVVVSASAIASRSEVWPSLGSTTSASVVTTIECEAS